MNKETLAQVIAEEFGNQLFSWLLEVYIDAQNKLMKDDVNENLTKEFVTINNFVFHKLTKLKEETKELEKRLIPEWVNKEVIKVMEISSQGVTKFKREDNT